MEKQTKEIIIGQGLADIKFGLTREEVLSIAGEPSEKDMETLAEEGIQSEIWHYDKLDLSVGFDGEEDWRLVSLAVTGSDYVFNSKSLMGMKRDDVEDFLETSDLSDLELDDLADDGETDQCLLVSEEKEINFWFEEDVLTEIQWGPLFEGDDVIVWPAK